MGAAELDLFADVVPFVAAAEARSFRAAARRLGVTPSAVSKAVARLEGALGVLLLHRTSRSVTLTIEGEELLRRCRDAMDQVQAGRELVSQAQDAPRGLLRVSMPLALGKFVVMPALPRLLTRHPGLRVEALLTDRLASLPEENVDVAVRISQNPMSQLVARRLREVRWMTAASPQYLARHGVPASPADLERHNCIKFMLPSGVQREWVYRAGAPGEVTTVRTQGNLVADHGEALVEAAVAGLGVVQALDFIVAGAIAAGRLLEVLRDYTAPGLPVTALWTPGRHGSPRVRAFVAFLVELLGAP